MRAVTLALALAFGFGCGDSSAPSVTPQTLLRVAGDSQGALTGTPLPSPLVVRVTGSDGGSFAGAVVTWTVTAGSATLGAPSDTTDSLGQGSTTVMLGATGGPIGVQAAVASLTPVTFTATGCDHPVLALGGSVGAALATTDCRLNNFYTDFYELTVPTGPQGLTLTMTSGAFDTWLELYRATGDFVAFDDDVDSTNTNSQLDAIVVPGDYLLAPSSFAPNVVGAYNVSAAAVPAALAGCGLVWTMRGVAISDSVTAGDCVDTAGGPHYADAVVLFLEAGSVLTVLHQSTAFDAALFLHTGAGASVASNNDSANATGTTTNAYLVYPVAQTGSYLLFVATADSSATGPYTLSISASATLSGSAPARASERPVLRFAPLRLPKGLPRRGWAR